MCVSLSFLFLFLFLFYLDVMGVGEERVIIVINKAEGIELKKVDEHWVCYVEHRIQRGIISPHSNYA